MSDENEHETKIKEEFNVSRKTRSRTKTKNEIAVEYIKSENEAIYYEIESIKQRLQSYNESVSEYCGNSTSKPNPFPVTEYDLKNEKNKIAMQKKRQCDSNYRLREKEKNKLAMRLKRRVDEDYRIREKERNRVAMQMRRKREKVKFVGVETDEDVQDAE